MHACTHTRAQLEGKMYARYKSTTTPVTTPRDNKRCTDRACQDQLPLQVVVLASCGLTKVKLHSCDTGLLHHLPLLQTYTHEHIHVHVHVHKHTRTNARARTRTRTRTQLAVHARTGTRSSHDPEDCRHKHAHTICDMPYPRKTLSGGVLFSPGHTRQSHADENEEKEKDKKKNKRQSQKQKQPGAGTMRTRVAAQIGSPHEVEHTTKEACTHATMKQRGNRCDMEVAPKQKT